MLRAEGERKTAFYTKTPSVVRVIVRKLLRPRRTCRKDIHIFITSPKNTTITGRTTGRTDVGRASVLLLSSLYCAERNNGHLVVANGPPPTRVRFPAVAISRNDTNSVTVGSRCAGFSSFPETTYVVCDERHTHTQRKTEATFHTKIIKLVSLKKC